MVEGGRSVVDKEESERGREEDGEREDLEATNGRGGGRETERYKFNK